MINYTTISRILDEAGVDPSDVQQIEIDTSGVWITLFCKAEGTLLHYLGNPMFYRLHFDLHRDDEHTHDDGHDHGHAHEVLDMSEETP
jgi:hypothetical protein